MITAQEIKDKALKSGACDLILGADTVADLVALMGTPQGREFCKLHRFPTLEMLRDYDKEELASLHFYVDAGDIELSNTDNVVVAGDTRATLKYSGTDKPYHAVVMHGAKANVLAGGYAALQVTNIGGEVATFSGAHAKIVVR